MRTLKQNRPIIGVLAGWHAYTGTIHSFLERVYQGVQAAAAELDCNLLIGCGVGASLGLQGGPTALPFQTDHCDFIPVGAWNTDGLLAFGSFFQPEAKQYFQDLIQAGFPVVYGGDQESAPAVAVDNVGGVIKAVNHLVKHGHQQIAFVAGHPGENNGDTIARLRGYQQGLLQNGLAYHPEMVEYGHNSREGGYLAMRAIMDRGQAVSAVVANNDECALGVVDAAREAGLMIPQDLAIIGFDDRLEARAHAPLLTTVRYPMFELGYQSLQLLVQMVRGSAPLQSFIQLPTHLVVRESCGCLPGADEDAEKLAIGTAGSIPVEIPGRGNDWSAPVFFHGGKTHPVEQQVAARPKTRSSSGDTEVIANLSKTIVQETQRLDRKEAQYLSTRLVDAYQQSIYQGKPTIFRTALQQILEHVADLGDDLYGWQAVVSIFKDYSPSLSGSVSPLLNPDQIDAMLHQSRIAISEVSRGQNARLAVHSTAISNHLGMMTARFFAAQSEAEIFAIFTHYLPEFDIQRAVVAFYGSGEEDPFLWSDAHLSVQDMDAAQVFLTRSFPPQEICSEDRAFQFAVLPLMGIDKPIGFAAFETRALEPLGAIVRQLVAALRSVRLYQDAVSARKMAEEARREAEEANYQKSRYLSIVSHELRTPLNLIFGLSNMMIEENLAVNDQDCLVNRKDVQRIFIGAQHLESLIRDVLDLARMDMNQLTLLDEPVDLVEVLEGISLIGERLALDKDLAWITEVPAALPRVRGDRTRLRQVILNLVNNAVKFTDAGSVTLSAKIRQNTISLEVRDTGLGIAIDEQKIIFDEFRQANRTTARGFGGLGLGLAICKRLIEMQQGTISVCSSGEEGAGSVFSIQLPVIREALPPELPAVEPGAEQRVLLLVKERYSGEALEAHLTNQGYSVTVEAAANPCAWTHWLKDPSLQKIIMDVDLAATHGGEILRILQENPDTRAIPIVFYALDEEQDRGAQFDFNILTKPFNTTDLANELLAHGISGDQAESPRRSLLIVDDDPEALALHTRIVQSLAVRQRILTAQNGREALDLIRAEHPALVLLDLMMPEMDGFAVLEAMQSDETCHNIPVIVLTSQVLTEADMQRFQHGVLHVLGKGIFRAQETLQHISAALSRQQRLHSETQRLVFKAMAFIHQNYQDPISRSNIAAHVGVSERHLSRCFQQELGLSPNVYLNRFRIRIAKELLDAGNNRITDVAMEAGFSAGGYFTRVFRDEVGQSPREYMRSKIT